MGRKAFWWAMAACLILRWILGTQPGYVADVNAYKRWAIGAARNGLPAIYETTDFDYPPLYGYILYPIGAVYLALAPDTPPGTLPDSTLLTLLIKLPPFLFDLLLARFLFLLVARRGLWGKERAGPARGRLAALLYLWNPVVLWDCAYWGQPDGIHSAFVVAALMLLSKDRFAGSAASLSAGVLMKPLAAPLAPLVVLAAWARGKGAGLLSTAAGALAVVVVSFLPFLLTGRIGPVLDKVILDVEAMPYTSVNGHNLWWLLGPWRDANLPLLGPLTAKQIGLGLFGIAFAAILWRVWGAMRGEAPGAAGREVSEADPSAQSRAAAWLFAVSAAITGAFFFLSTHMHENHLFMMVPLTLALAGRSRRWTWIAAATSLAVLMNLLIHDLDVALLPPFSWGGPSPVENRHLMRPFAWGELIGTYVDTALVAVAVVWTYLETWRFLSARNEAATQR